MGGATKRAARGVSVMKIQRQGMWKSYAFMIYVKATREEKDRRSRVLAFNAMAAVIHSRQVAKRGGGVETEKNV